MVSEPVLGTPSVAMARRRAAWTIGDQVVSSAQSFAVSLTVTHSTGLSGIGAFAVAFTVYQLLMAVNRPLNTDSLTVGFAASDAATQRPAAAAAAGGALALGLLAGLCCALAGWLLEAPTGPVLLVFSLGIPVLLVQDAWRYAFFTDGRPAKAFLNDSVVLVALGPCFWWAAHVAPHSAASIVAAWGAATAVGAVLGGLQAKARPAVENVVRWWRATLHLGFRMLGENVIAVAALGAGLFAIAAGAGVQELGRLRTAQVSLGAVSPVIIALSTIVAAEGTRLLAGEPLRFPKLIRLAGVGSAALTLALALFWLTAPAVLGRTLIGPSWDSSRQLVLSSGLYLAASGVTLAASGALRALRQPAGALRARATAAPVTVLGGVLGAVYGGAGPAILGIAAGEALCALLTIRACRSVWRSWREHPWAIDPLVTAIPDPAPT